MFIHLFSISSLLKSGNFCARPKTSAFCNASVNDAGVSTAAMSFVPLLNAMLIDFLIFNSSGFVKLTGIFFKPILVATKCLWCPLNISPSASANTGKTNPSFLKLSSIMSSLFGSAVLGLYAEGLSSSNPTNLIDIKNLTSVEFRHLHHFLQNQHLP